ncbi:argininosuccinate lyase [Olsenella sp. DNF00959]|uniref:argininosuccinate lyase n=1 Tax=Olsenella sp. DNF00959 TaxID=1476999 RepID=UPI00078164D8|nr:argininosuccinate lyase [Olsenella sp. DNF00959]KXB61835.1 argininosuccinate lyase [Olsenella sp. DNF00959]
MALWSGRFEQGVDELTQRFGASLEVDKSMCRQDIAGSMAHARMLADQGIIGVDDAERIQEGLSRILTQIDDGDFEWDVNDEDVHMAVESKLTQMVGPAGARLHTGRSRNDQVALDLRLLAKDLLAQLMRGNLALRRTLLDEAVARRGVVMPGYTHLQHAQPVFLSHHLLAYFWMLGRDFKRLSFAFDEADANPLGAAALAGTTYPIDRFQTTKSLGLDHPIPNSMDAVSDRDYLLDLLYACSVSMMHLSRLCEEIVLWSTTEFGFVTLSDSYSTGSSIMPQKKNPDFAELTRGKTGRVYGDLVALLTTMKSLPLAYNKDLQECKEGPLDAAHTLLDCMACVRGMVSTWRLDEGRMEEESGKGFTAATDVADYLAKRGVPFRKAHEVVGELVLYCERHHKGLEDLTPEEFRQASELFDSDVTEDLDPRGIVSARNSYGGTGTQALARQLEEARAALEADEGSLAGE